LEEFMIVARLLKIFRTKKTAPAIASKLSRNDAPRIAASQINARATGETETITTNATTRSVNANPACVSSVRLPEGIILTAVSNKSRAKLLAVSGLRMRENRRFI
jgi:hypothetical protein